MTWAKLDDGILDNPKVARTGVLGFALYAAGLVYACRNLTDGFIPWGTARRLVPTQWTDDERRIWQVGAASGAHGLDEDEAIEHAIGRLTAVGLWSQVTGGYEIHDFLDWNRSREHVLAERTRALAARHRGAEAVKRDGAGRFTTGHEPAGDTVDDRSRIRSRIRSRTATRGSRSDLDLALGTSQTSLDRRFASEEGGDRGKPRDPAFVALCAAEGSDPEALTRRARRTVGVALAEIREVMADVDAAEIGRRARIYRARYRDAELTASALAKHWPRLGTEPASAGQDYAPLTLQAREAEWERIEREREEELA